jgi:hypothetical protein
MRENRHMGFRSRLLIGFAATTAALVALLSVASNAAGAREIELPVIVERTASPCGPTEAGPPGDGSRSRAAYEDTLWIFDADFEDLLGDNAGWSTEDVSGTLGVTDYWHHDTIRLTEAYLGESTWWCGTYDPCWRQSRGYGNDWLCVLEREFPLSVWSVPGDDVTLEWDQRYAIERNYDYGYVDVCVSGSGSWVTLATYTNVGFLGAGVPVDWTSPTLGHPVIDVSEYAGFDLSLRFRFESDCCYSAQDQDDNVQHSVKDGAWQLDNITLAVNDETLFFDDSESGGQGWVHDDVPATGQAGVAFRRSYEDFWVPCQPPRHHEGWMMVAYDSLAGAMVDGERTWLTTPVIDIAGAWNLVGQWEGYVHVRGSSNDYLECRYASSDDPNCWQFVSLCWWWPGYDWAEWEVVFEELDSFVGNDWFRMRWILGNDDPAPPMEPHGVGLALDRLRIGIPLGNKTRFEIDVWNQFYDTFDVAEALSESARVRIRDEDGIDVAYLVASGDGGSAWGSYALTPILGSDGWWHVPPPSGEIALATEIRYYFESTDGLGNVRTFPRDAPGDCFEFSILPIVGSMANPGMLLVDKHGRAIPGEHRDFRNASEDYYREALDILGLAYDVYDVRVPSGSIYSEGPGFAAMQNYSTQIWFTGDVNAYTLWPMDQYNLLLWLNQSAPGEDRNLLLTGNDIGYELIQCGRETLQFYTTWLGSDYVQNDAGAAADTMPRLRDAPGGFDFMTYGDRECFLWDDG